MTHMNDVPRTTPVSQPAAEPMPVRARLTIGAELAQLAALVVAGVGLYFVVGQLSAIVRSNEVNSLVGVYAQSVSVGEFMIEHPKLRVHFYRDDRRDGEASSNEELKRQLDELDAEAYSEVMGAAELLADLFEHVFVLRNTMPEKQWTAWCAYFQSTYESSPALQRFYEQNQAWYELTQHLLGDTASRGARLRAARTSG